LDDLGVTIADTCNSGSPDPIDDPLTILEIIIYAFCADCHRWLPRGTEKDGSRLALAHVVEKL